MGQGLAWPRADSSGDRLTAEPTIGPTTARSTPTRPGGPASQIAAGRVPALPVHAPRGRGDPCTRAGARLAGDVMAIPGPRRPGGTGGDPLHIASRLLRATRDSKRGRKSSGCAVLALFMLAAPLLFAMAIKAVA